MKLMAKEIFKRNIHMGIWTACGQIFFAFGQFLIVTLIARESVSLLGTYGLALAIVSPVQMFCALSLPKLYVTDKNAERHLYTYVLLNSILSIIIIPISYLVLLAVAANSELVLITMILSVLKAILNSREFILGVMQRNHQLDQVGKSQIGLALLVSVFFGVTFFVTKDLPKAMSVHLIVVLIYFVFIDINIARQYFGKQTYSHHRKILFQIIKYGSPLGVTAWLTSVKTNIPKYFLAAFVSREAVGIYTALFQIGAILEVGNQAIVKTITRKLANLYEINNERFLNIVKLFIVGVLMTSCIVTLCVSMWGSHFLNLMYGKDFSKFGFLLVVVILARMFSMSSAYCKLAQIIQRNVGYQLVVTFLTVLISSGVVYFMVVKYGEQGVYISMVFSEFMLFCLLYQSLKKRVK